MNAGIIEYYDNMLPDMAKYYEVKNSRLSRIAKNLSSFITPEMKVLDVGCGVGYLSRHLSNLGAVVTGIDISPKLIEFAKEKVSDVKFIVGDIFEQDIKEKFDVILFADSLEHFSPETLDDRFRKLIENITNDKTLIYVNIPDKNFMVFIAENHSEKKQIEDNAYSVGEVVSLFSYCGFEPISMAIYGVDVQVQWNEYIFIKNENLKEHYKRNL